MFSSVFSLSVLKVYNMCMYYHELDVLMRFSRVTYSPYKHQENDLETSLEKLNFLLASYMIYMTYAEIGRKWPIRCNEYLSGSSDCL